MSDIEPQIAVTTKALYDLARAWANLPYELQTQMARNSLNVVQIVIDSWAEELEIDQVWDRNLHPADILDKYIFPELADRLNGRN